MRLNGLIAATYTPLRANGELNFDQVGPMVEFLRDRQQVDGLYVCGSTGEGISLTGAERRQVAATYVDAATGAFPVVVQVGHNSLAEAQELARHAQEIGASAVSANAPSYFKVGDVDTLVASMREIAFGAPDLPFYYYHIPHLTGAQIDMLEFLKRASDVIPNLAGIKFTAPTLHEYRACVLHEGKRFDILWGSDEMLLPALSMGTMGAVGSTYNIAGPVYRRVMNEFATGHLTAAQDFQDRANAMISTIYKYPFHSAMKSVLGMLGVECGQCRLPQKQISPEDLRQLRNELEGIGFFKW